MWYAFCCVIYPTRIARSKDARLYPAKAGHGSGLRIGAAIECDDMKSPMEQAR
jgi:hypothetical protein